MLPALVSLICGTLFGLGLAVSGMVYPQKVTAFLNIIGPWDATLIMVLGGATGLCLITFPLILRLKHPALATYFALPQQHKISRSLISGSLLFGLGWGISGYCPGPALARLSYPDRESIVFVLCMLLGSWLQQRWARHNQLPQTDD
ncbi:MAG: YeeE/YedE family protein [Pseudomonadales bacterium]|nr:YeeE/YedE family protein [Pseudomonadales bacterium]